MKNSHMQVLYVITSRNDKILRIGQSLHKMRINAHKLKKIFKMNICGRRIADAVLSRQESLTGSIRKN